MGTTARSADHEQDSTDMPTGFKSPDVTVCETNLEQGSPVVLRCHVVRPGEILHGVHSPLDHGPQFTQLLPQRGIWLCALVTCGVTEAEVDNTANDAAAVWRASLRDATQADPSKPWNSGQHL